MRTRPNAFSPSGVVSSSSLQSSLVGARVLENGGNVADAAIATSAVLCVTQNNLCGLGGDMFSLIRMDGKKIVDLNGSGRAAGRATVDFFREKGFKELPYFGEYGAITVPGIVDAWNTINSKYGTMEMKDLLAPAIDLARNGFPVTHNYHRSIVGTARHLSKYGWADLFTPNGKAPEVGTLFKQKDLANSLSLIAEEGPETYYRGSLNDRILKGLENTGALFEEEDFRKHTTTLREPLKSEYNGYDIYETNPNSQAATTLLWLNLYRLMGGNAGKPEEESFSLAIKSGLLAYRERAKFIADPDHWKLPADFLSGDYAQKVIQEAGEIGPYSGARADPGDTTYFCLADGDGNSLSVIQSNFMGFGSGIVPKGTGFVIHNRGSYFSLDENHHNVVKPGKRTFHTLCAAMGERDGEFQFSMGTMGGDIQPQIHFQLLTSLIDKGIDPQLALDTPRWAFPHTIYEEPGEMIVEEPLYETLNSYRNKLLPLKKIGAMSSETGHAQIVQRNSSGVVIGGSDPRGDGVSIPVLKI